MTEIILYPEDLSKLLNQPQNLASFAFSNATVVQAAKQRNVWTIKLTFEFDLYINQASGTGMNKNFGEAVKSAVKSVLAKQKELYAKQ